MTWTVFITYRLSLKAMQRHNLVALALLVLRVHAFFAWAIRDETTTRSPASTMVESGLTPFRVAAANAVCVDAEPMSIIARERS